MKKIIVLVSVFVVVMIGRANAQYIREARPYPAHIVVRAGLPPFRGAIWIGPEWRWDVRMRDYVVVPGYWEHPGRGVWIAGHWRNTPRFGYQWVPGHWAR